MSLNDEGDKRAEESEVTEGRQIVQELNQEIQKSGSNAEVLGDALPLISKLLSSEVLNEDERGTLRLLIEKGPDLVSDIAFAIKTRKEQSEVVRGLISAVEAQQQPKKVTAADMNMNIDAEKAAQKISEIVDTDFFSNLKSKSGDMRRKTQQIGAQIQAKKQAEES